MALDLNAETVQEMFLRLPKRAPDGDAAIAEIWKMAKAEQEEP